MKAEGKHISRLDNEPRINVFEHNIIRASQSCNSISDIEAWTRIHGISDVPEFIDCVEFCKQKLTPKKDN